MQSFNMLKHSPHIQKDGMSVHGIPQFSALIIDKWKSSVSHIWGPISFIELQRLGSSGDACVLGHCKHSDFLFAAVPSTVAACRLGVEVDGKDGMEENGK
jgi:hypothetical protein